MRVLVVALTTSLALLVSACGLGSGGQDVTEHFEDESAQELAAAVASGSDSSIRELVEGGISVETTGNDGVTMLQWAIYEDKLPSLETLLDLGADPAVHGLGGSTAAHTAAIARRPVHLETLLAAGVDPDVRHATTERTPLMGAVGIDLGEHFSMLLEAGADVTLSDRTGLTALHLAAMLNAGPHVLELLDRGADPEAVSSTGATFQDYFWNTPADVMNERALEDRRLVAEWLQTNGIEVAQDARWTKE